MKTFTEHMQDCVGATHPLETILHNLSPEEIEEEAHIYAKEAAREALKNASENAGTKQGYCSDGWTPSVKVVDKSSILNESNIPDL